MKAGEILEELVLPYLDAAESGLLDDLNPKQGSKYWTLDCPGPECRGTHKANAYYWPTGTIVCNRVNSCQYTSSIWKYLVEEKGLSKQEAFLKLCQAVNIDPEQYKDGENEGKAPIHKAFQRIVRDFAEKYPKEVANFCSDRKFTLDDFKALNYGYYPSANEVREALFDKGYSMEEASTTGFIPYKKDDERKNNAYYMTGRIIGFWKQEDGYSYWGYLPKNKRDPNSDGKSLKDKKYLIATGIKKDIPYSYRPFRLDWPVLVEGTIDSDTLNLLGISSGSTGFNRITADQAKYLSSKGVKRLSFMMDGDLAGLSGAISSVFNCANESIECWMISTPFSLEDADAMRQKKQYSELFALLEMAVKPGEFLANVWAHARSTDDSRYLTFLSLIEAKITELPGVIQSDFYNQLNLYGYNDVRTTIEINKLQSIQKIDIKDQAVKDALDVIFKRGNNHGQ